MLSRASNDQNVQKMLRATWLRVLHWNHQYLFAVRQG